MSLTRSPRAGQAEKSLRADACHAVAVAVVNRPGSRAASAAGFRAYGGAAAPSGPQPPPGSPSSAPHTTTAAVAASAAFMCWRRRIRSVGRACSEQGSNSGEAEQRVRRRRHLRRLLQRRGRVRDTRLFEQPARIAGLGELLQTAQH